MGLRKDLEIWVIEGMQEKGLHVHTINTLTYIGILHTKGVDMFNT